MRIVVEMQKSSFLTLNFDTYNIHLVFIIIRNLKLEIVNWKSSASQSYFFSNYSLKSEASKDP
jgi:hypothetical protein